MFKINNDNNDNNHNNHNNNNTNSDNDNNTQKDNSAIKEALAASPPPGCRPLAIIGLWQRNRRESFDRPRALVRCLLLLYTLYLDGPMLATVWQSSGLGISIGSSLAVLLHLLLITFSTRAFICFMAFLFAVRGALTPGPQTFFGMLQPAISLAALAWLLRDAIKGRL